MATGRQLTDTHAPPFCCAQGLRPTSTILMGKNTMMKRSIRLYCEQTGNDKWQPLLELLVGNVGIVFTQGDLGEVKDEIDKYKVGAPARVGVIAPNDVRIPGGPTGMDPSQTSFFQVWPTAGVALFETLGQPLRSHQTGDEELMPGCSAGQCREVMPLQDTG